MTYLLSLNENVEVTIFMTVAIVLTVIIVECLARVDLANLFGWVVFWLLVLALIMGMG